MYLLYAFWFIFLLDIVRSCQEVLNEIDRPPPPGMYVPQCKADGSWREKQCHISIGYCWCVDENGEEIKGTKQNVRLNDTVVCVPGESDYEKP